MMLNDSRIMKKERKKERERDHGMVIDDQIESKSKQHKKMDESKKESKQNMHAPLQKEGVG